MLVIRAWPVLQQDHVIPYGLHQYNLAMQCLGTATKCCLLCFTHFEVGSLGPSFSPWFTRGNERSLKGLKAYNILHLGTQLVRIEVIVNPIHLSDVSGIFKAFSELNISSKILRKKWVWENLTEACLQFDINIFKKINREEKVWTCEYLLTTEALLQSQSPPVPSAPRSSYTLVQNHWGSHNRASTTRWSWGPVFNKQARGKESLCCNTN